VITGNRQRALGNLLHDAGHRNLVREGRLNDLLAEIFLSSSLFNSLTVYRDSHARHHAWLGDPNHDPDYIAANEAHASSWWTTYLRILCTISAWNGSAFGHLLTRGIPPSLRFRIVLWWLCALALLSTLVDLRFALLFFGIWLSAKATAFHAITTFREMCDHFGLRPGGIFSFTRDISTTSPWRWILHPRHNGYHLTHHLMPAVPYYRVRRTHELLSQLPVYETRATCCDTYFRGRGAVVRRWSAGTASCSIEA
jgi:fatty acid desaturase